jgi:hypothetical protein
MKTRAFWIAALVSALTAILLHWAALAKAADGVRSFNSCANLDTPEKQRQVFLDEAHHFYNISNNLRCAGIAVAILSVVCLFVSKRKDESVRYSVVVVLLAVYLLLQFAVV